MNIWTYARIDLEHMKGIENVEVVEPCLPDSAWFTKDEAILAILDEVNENQDEHNRHFNEDPGSDTVYRTYEVTDLEFDEVKDNFGGIFGDRGRWFYEEGNQMFVLYSVPLMDKRRNR